MQSLQHHFCSCIDAIQGFMSWPVTIISVTRIKSFFKKKWKLDVAPFEIENYREREYWAMCARVPVRKSIILLRVFARMVAETSYKVQKFYHFVIVRELSLLQEK